MADDFERMATSLQASRHRRPRDAFGVDVKLILPGIPDKKRVKHITEYHYGELIRHGVEIYEYTPGFIHQKVIFNEFSSVVGTINMDFRSFYLHYEMGVWSRDEELLEFSYPKAEMLFKAKYSVSELKHKSMEAYYDSDTIQVIPDFAGEGKADKGDVNTGAVKGTAMHLFMEHFDFASAQGESAVDEQIELMVERGHMTEEQAGLLDREKIKTFTTTELFGRMARAAGRGLLFVEQPFVMGDHPDELLGDYYPDRSLPSGDGSPMLLVQGIIDAFFVEDDGIVVVDYKTDRVKKAEELIGRYKKQMELYADALHRGFGKKVSQRIIYSFALDDEVIL